MESIPASLDMTRIRAKFEEYATYTLQTDEVTDIIIMQGFGNRSPLTVITREPVDGVIKLEIDSRVVGEVKIHAISETKYAAEVKVAVD
jgi:hypothetical protein